MAFLRYPTVHTRVSIFLELFQFSSPGTFGLVKSQDFLVPGRDSPAGNPTTYLVSRFKLKTEFEFLSNPLN